MMPNECEEEDDNGGDTEEWEDELPGADDSDLDDGD